MKSRETQFSELANTCQEAIASYQVWWALANRAREKHENEILLFLDFFSVVIISSFDKFVIATTTLCEVNRSMFGVQKFLTSNNFSAQTKTKWKNILDGNDNLIANIRNVRNKVAAHIDWKATEAEVFATYGFIPNQAYKLILQVAEFLSAISEDIGVQANITKSKRYEFCALHVVKSLSKLQSQQRAEIRESYLIDPLKNG